MSTSSLQSAVSLVSRTIEAAASPLQNSQTLGYKQITPFLVPTGQGGMETSGATPSLSVLQSFTDMSLGARVDTASNPFSFYIMQPDCFIAVTLPDGSLGYVRTGMFSISAEGNWIHAPTGYTLSEAQAMPQNLESVTINPLGQVLVHESGQQGAQEAFRIGLYKFINPSGLALGADGVYHPTTTSGDPIAGNAGDTGFGTLQQGSVEGSNVDLTKSLLFFVGLQPLFQALVYANTSEMSNLKKISDQMNAT